MELKSHKECDERKICDRESSFEWSTCDVEVRHCTFTQSYMISDSLEMAIPLEQGQNEVNLQDASTVAIRKEDLYTVMYDHTGYAVGYMRAHFSESSSMIMEIVPKKRGLAVFLQHFFIVGDLEKAIPVQPGQKHVFLSDGTSRAVDADHTYAVYYGRHGFVLFYKTPGGSVVPGYPTAVGIGCLAVAHEVLSSSLCQPVGMAHFETKKNNIHTAVFDNQGLPICIRHSSGTVIPCGSSLSLKGICHRVEFYFVATDDYDVPIRISSLLDHSMIELITGDHVESMAEDICYVVKDAEGGDLATYYDARNPSFRHESRSKLFRQLANFRGDPEMKGFEGDQVIHFSLRAVSEKGGARVAVETIPRKPQLVIEDEDSDADRARNLDVERRIDRLGRFRANKSAETRRVDRSSEEPPPRDTNSRANRLERRRDGVLRALQESSSESAAVSKKPGCALGVAIAKSKLVGDPEVQPIERLRLEWAAESASGLGSSEEGEGCVAREQLYFVPGEIDYAIPVLPDQRCVKLANGERVMLSKNRVFSMEYDGRRGFLSCKRKSWMLGKAGMGLKFQDYAVSKELMLAVPISPGQQEISVSDGSILPVNSCEIITVFYDAIGKPAFTVANGRRNKSRIKPGLINAPGVGHYVKYFMVVDSNLVNICPALVSQIPHPENKKKTLKVELQKLVVMFFDEDGSALYTELSDGTFIDGSAAVLSEDDGSVNAVSPGAVQGQRSSMVYQVLRERSSVGSHGISSESPVLRKRQEIIERRIPVKKIEFIDKVVEVPEIRHVEKRVEVEQIEWKTRIVKKKQVVERPVEHVKYVPKIETKIVERIIEVPEIIEIPRIELIEQKVTVDRFVDTETEVAVARKINPLIRESNNLIEDVECLRLEPELMPVDVFVPRLVASKLIATGNTTETARKMEVPLAHYNSLVLKMNPRFANNYEKMPMIKTNSGCFPLLTADRQITVLPPTVDEITRVLIAAGMVGNK